MNDYELIEKIHEVLDYEEWSPETLDKIAELLSMAGFEIHGPDDLRTHPISEDLVDVGDPFEWEGIDCHYYGVYIAKGVRVCIWDDHEDESIVKMQVIDHGLRKADGTKDYENMTRLVPLPPIASKAGFPLLSELAETVKGARG